MFRRIILSVSSIAVSVSVFTVTIIIFISIIIVVCFLINAADFSYLIHDLMRHLVSDVLSLLIVVLSCIIIILQNFPPVITFIRFVPDNITTNSCTDKGFNTHYALQKI